MIGDEVNGDVGWLMILGESPTEPFDLLLLV